MVVIKYNIEPRFVFMTVGVFDYAYFDKFKSETKLEHFMKNKRV